MITIFAGADNESQKFTVHKHFATFYSPMLKAAFKSKCVEGRTQSFYLNTSTEAEVLLVSWFYTQNLSVREEENVGYEEMYKEDNSLVDLYVLTSAL